MSKIWFITGANRGFGKEFARAALLRGDKVAATGRNPAGLDDLASEFGANFLPLTLDVTDRQAVFAAVAAAAKAFGRLDVVVNNAGYGLFGAVEEVSIDEVRYQMEVNFFGLLNVTQAVLPVMRQQGSGHIIQVSSVGGVAAFPNLGAYHASKWAVEGLSESLAQEVAGFGIKVTIVEPGPFGTDWAGSSAVHATPQPQYEPLRQAMASRQLPPELIGSPAAAGSALLQIVDAAAPPLRVLFGTMPTHIVPQLYASRLKTWSDWDHVAKAVNGG